MRPARRETVYWVLIILGGLLQYGYLQLQHPPTVLRVLEVTYGLVLIMCVVLLAISVVNGALERVMARRGVREKRLR
jgi:hypothetical protein